MKEQLWLVWSDFCDRSASKTLDSQILFSKETVYRTSSSKVSVKGPRQIIELAMASEGSILSDDATRKSNVLSKLILNLDLLLCQNRQETELVQEFSVRIYTWVCHVTERKFGNSDRNLTGNQIPCRSLGPLRFRQGPRARSWGERDTPSTTTRLQSTAIPYLRLLDWLG